MQKNHLRHFFFFFDQQVLGTYYAKCQGQYGFWPYGTDILVGEERENVQLVFVVVVDDDKVI